MDKKPKTFQETLTRADFTHNTLRQHHDQLLSRGLVERHRQPQAVPGRPVYVHSIPNIVGRPLSVILSPGVGLVVLSFVGWGVCAGMRRVVAVRMLGVAVVPGGALES